MIRLWIEPGGGLGEMLLSGDGLLKHSAGVMAVEDWLVPQTHGCSEPKAQGVKQGASEAELLAWGVELRARSAKLEASPCELLARAAEQMASLMEPEARLWELWAW